MWISTLSSNGITFISLLKSCFNATSLLRIRFPIVLCPSFSPPLITKGAQSFGSQCIVVAIDAKRIRDSIPLQWEVYIHGGRARTGIEAIEWARRAESLGAGEILLTSMDCDGTKEGYDLELTRTVSKTVRIPVIASDGARNLDHLYRAFTEVKADAVLAASQQF